MAKLKLKHIFANLALLMQTGNTEVARQLIARACYLVHRFEDWKSLQEIMLQSIAQESLQHEPAFVKTYVRALIGSGQFENAEDFIVTSAIYHSGQTKAFLEVELAICLHKTARTESGIQLLIPAMQHLTGQDLGIAWSRLGIMRFALNQPDWLEAFLEMHKWLADRMLGIQLLLLGNCYYLQEAYDQAISTYQEASQLLINDPLNHAYAESNIGLTYLLQCDPKAHTFLENAERRTRHTNFSKQHPDFIKSLAASYRLRGEWQEAVSLYNRAFERSPYPVVKLEVLTNLGRTLRLSGNQTQAKEILKAALGFAAKNNLNPSPARLELAALDLMQWRSAKAGKQLEQTRQLQGADVHFLNLLSAELARQLGNKATCLELLLKIPMQHRLTREESRYWTELWSLAQYCSLEIPAPLSWMGTRIIILRKTDLLLDDVPREVSSGTLDFLRFLFGKGGSVQLEEIYIEFFAPRLKSKDETPGVTDSALKQLTARARKALGWKDSVRSQSKKRSLDPNSIWKLE